MQRDAAYVNPALAGAATVGAMTQAMKDAANNPNGAAVGFMGVNMAQQMGGVNVNQLYQQAAAQQAQPAPAAPAAPAEGAWICPKCGKENTSNFCGNCGTPKPVSDKWICPTCGTENTANFCGNCGTKKPE
jgi:membrane protease subunit (stomatin/prohibitin family)